MKIERVKYKDIEQIPNININKKFKQNFSGSSPAPFIGRYGYPNINVGFLSPQFSGDTSYYDSPQIWSKSKFPIGSIANLRYGLVNSRTEASIKDALKNWDSKREEFIGSSDSMIGHNSAGLLQIEEPTTTVEI